jgi:O-antigen ligase
VGRRAIVIAAVLLALLERRHRLAIVLGVVVLAGGTIALPQTRTRLFETSPHSAESVTGHLLLATETARLVASHPLLGVGPSGFVDAIPAEHDQRWDREIGSANPPDSPENWLLQVASSGGIPLLAIALALTTIVIRRALRSVRIAPTTQTRAELVGLLGGLAGYAVTLLFHFTSPGTTPLAALFAGALVAAPGRYAVPPRRAAATVGRRRRGRCRPRIRTTRPRRRPRRSRARHAMGVQGAGRLAQLDPSAGR